MAAKRDAAVKSATPFTVVRVSRAGRRDVEFRAFSVIV